VDVKKRGWSSNVSDNWAHFIPFVFLSQQIFKTFHNLYPLSEATFIFSRRILL